MSIFNERAISFRDFINTGGSLRKEDTGYIAEYGSTKERYTHTFSRADIALFDTRMPIVVDALFTGEYGKKTAGRVYAKALALTLHHWQFDTPVRCEDHCKRYITRINSVQDYMEHRSTVKLNANTYADILYVEDIPYVTHSRDTVFSVNKKELEKHFPGWKLRHDLMLEVQGGPSTLINAVFTRPTTSTSNALDTQLPGVQFD